MSDALMTALSYLPIVCALIVCLLAVVLAYRGASDARKVPGAAKHAESLCNLRAKLARTADEVAADEAFNETIAGISRRVEARESVAKLGAWAEKTVREERLARAVEAARHSYSFTPNGTRLGVGPHRIGSKRS